MKRFLVVLSALCLFMSVTVSAQEQDDDKQELNLEKISDDMKYKNGVGFIKLKRYEKALQELHEYLEIYYDGIHRDEAYRNIAEIYFKRFEYQKAIQVYRSLYEEFSNSEAGVEAYYRIGICYRKMGFDEKAQDVFRTILTDHPDSGHAARARVQLDLLSILKDSAPSTEQGPVPEIQPGPQVSDAGTPE